ncbi:MAG: ParB/RepB/Spo0J family partition protein [Candidatus Marinimicrobia bacterium]|nr:ParB/RepB/Spo0J family partition protein [Candidatus Neomarinimicrobiota bacterium]
MTAKKLGSRLGKGISAIIPEVPEIVESASKIFEIKLSDIKTNRHQPRKSFNPEAMQELVDSIRENGLIQPITVRPVDNGYELIAGERRFRACVELNFEQVPAHVLPVTSDVAMMELALIENVQREDLNPIEESEGYYVLASTFDMSHEEIAKKVGKKRSSITNSIRLLNLPRLIIDDLRAGKLSAGHARPLLNIENEQQQLNLWRRIIDEGLSVRATETLAKGLKDINIRTISKPVETKSSFAREIEEKMMHIVGTKVNLRGNQSKGTIEIKYYSEEDLTRLLDLFQTIEE